MVLGLVWAAENIHRSHFSLLESIWLCIFPWRVCLTSAVYPPPSLPNMIMSYDLHHITHTHTPFWPSCLPKEEACATLHQ